MALVPDIREGEHYISAALNRKFFGPMPPGVYLGYVLSPGNGMELSVAPGPEGVSVALVDFDGYSLTVSTKATEILDLGVSDQDRTLRIVIEALYVQGNTETTAELKAILAENVQDHHVVLGTVVIPANATQLTAEMIAGTGREIAPTTATHLAADPAHPADRIEFDNSTANLDGDPDRVQAALEAVKAAIDGASGDLADHQAADPAHAAAKISFDNSSAQLPGSPDRVQAAIEALAGNSSAYAAAGVKSVTVEAISTTELKISKGEVSLPELGEDQVTNGNFETGDTTGWTGADATLTATGGAAQSGSYGLEVTASADGGSAQAVITVEPEKFYRLTAHLKSSASGHQVRVTVRDQDHGIFLHQPDYEDLTDYTKRQALVFVPPGCTQVRLDLQVETSGQVGWFDNVSLEPVEFITCYLPGDLTLTPSGLSASTFYYVKLEKPATGNIITAGQVSVVTTAPTPSGIPSLWFDGALRVIGAARTNASSEFLTYRYYGQGMYLYDEAQPELNYGTATTWTDVDLAFVPGFTRIFYGHLLAEVYGSCYHYFLFVRAKGATGDGHLSHTTATFRWGSTAVEFQQTGQAMHQIGTDENQTIQYIVGGTGGSGYRGYIYTNGWLWP